MARTTGKAPSDHELGLVISQIRCSFSLDFVRAQGLCLLSRLCHLGEGAQAAAERRRMTLREVEEARKDQTSHFLAHIQGRGLRREGEVYRRH